jgi:aryl-alcohol dehydrogenase-like predicted oxidoreductase
MQSITDARHVSMARIALAWVLQCPFVMSVIIGAKSIEELDVTLAAIEVTFDADKLKKLDQVTALPPKYPGWMIEWQYAARPSQTKSPRPILDFA